MLFKNYIYINEDLLIDLAKQAKVKQGSETTKVTQTNNKVGIGTKLLSGESGNSSTSTESYTNDKIDLLQKFEKKMEEDETGIIDFDFDEAEHIFNGQLIRFTAKMLKPSGENEDLQLITSINQNELFKSMLEEKIGTEDEDSKQLFNLLLKSSDNNPVYFSTDDNYIVVSNVKIDSLMVSYEDFQENFDEEVTVTLLVEKKYSNEEDVVILDAMKDILKIGRDIRRRLDKAEQEKYIIKEKGPALRGKILSITK